MVAFLHAHAPTSLRETPSSPPLCASSPSSTTASSSPRQRGSLVAAAPQHTVVGCRDGYFDVSREHEVVAAVRAAAPDVLLVALGNPVQEKFWARNAAALEVPLAFGVGAPFDFLAPRVTRAAQWVLRVRAVWVWRHAQEPGRLWRRHLVGNVAFIVRLLLSPRRD